MLLKQAGVVARNLGGYPRHVREEALKVLTEWLAANAKSGTLLAWDRRRYVIALHDSLKDEAV